MDVFFGEWVNLALRWAHLVVGIGWIGTSFYFMGLDYSLMKRERMNPGVMGTAWQVHGGGFYHVEKYTVAPPSLPDALHWFIWEAYLTWATGWPHHRRVLFPRRRLPDRPVGDAADAVAGHRHFDRLAHRRLVHL